MASQTTLPGETRTTPIAWTLILGLLTIDLLWLAFTQVSIEPASLALPLGAGAALLAGSRFYSKRRGEPRVADALECISQIVTFSAAGAVLSYLVITPGLPMQDALFDRLDKALGLDWLGYLAWLNRNAWLAPMLTAAYQSFLFQVIIVVLTLSFSGNGIAARTMILAMMLSAVVIIAISGLLPARSTFAFFNLSPADYPNLHPAAAFIHLPDLMALHADTPLHVDLRQAHGIITFPSYHAALGLLLLIGGWQNLWLRWPSLVINLAMIAATPIDGGHYFVDVLAGLAIAAASYAGARHLIGHRATGIAPSGINAKPVGSPTLTPSTG